MIKEVYEHFSSVAPKYRELRTTDIEPILRIAEYLQSWDHIKVADIGCGCGRYISKLLNYLGDKIDLFYCVDTNENMLKQLKEYLSKMKITNCQEVQACASNVPIQYNSLHCIFNFNAIHHFNISEFLNEASRALLYGGYLFMYTRTRSQNSRNIWGDFFPSFAQKETRLFEIVELESYINKNYRLELEDVECFTQVRSNNLDELVEKARNRHYSTFSLYANDEFERSLNTFINTIKNQFNDLQNIEWRNENVLYVIRKKEE